LFIILLGEWKQLKNISKEKALVVLVVDLLDFPSSCLTHIREFVGPHNNIILLINKIDLLKKLNFKNDTLKKDLYKGVLNYATIKKSLPKLVSIVVISVNINALLCYFCLSYTVVLTINNF
jgi:ribosome biogenesis GTPase A